MRNAHAEHNRSALTLIADMDFRRYGAMNGLMQRNKKRVFAVGTRVTSRPSRSVRAALDKAEQAHRRSDALDKRRKLMEAWATYCEPKGSVTVVQMRKRKWIEGAYS